MDEAELRDLQERAHQIRELTKTSGWELLRDYVATVLNAKNRGLLNGNAKTLEDYRADAGFISGAQFVLGAADELEARIDRVTKEMALAKTL